MPGLQELRDEKEFDNLLAMSEPLVADFSAVWCGPCRMLAPILQEIATKNPNFNFVKIDIDKIPALAARYNITSVPMVAIFKGGKKVDAFLGARDAAFVQAFLDNNRN